MSELKLSPIEKWVVRPVSEFINKSTTGGMVLIASAAIAVFLANSPWKEAFFHFWETEIGFSFGSFTLSNTLHHWINDGLMAIFFFVVGLELKREIVGGELSNPKKAILPIVAGIGGMVFPALVYTFFNGGTEAARGWGIPMATDIAFALGVLFLLGNRVPIALKVFLTAFAIVDDLGAVLVIAIFYTDQISLMHLAIGLSGVVVLLFANRLGVRSPLVYAIIGIGCVWYCFLVSGVHATIASVLVAFTIPAKTKVSESYFVKQVRGYLDQFKSIDADNKQKVLTSEQMHILNGVEHLVNAALTPLQKLEHALHPFVTFFVIPVFALANAGVTFEQEMLSNIANPITLGVAFGLFFGKIIGIFGLCSLFIKLKWAPMPEGMNYKHLFGAGLLGGIGFTMSLFVSELAFIDPLHHAEAKLAILAMSVIAGVCGYLYLNAVLKKPVLPNN